MSCASCVGGGSFGPVNSSGCGTRLCTPTLRKGNGSTIIPYSSGAGTTLSSYVATNVSLGFGNTTPILALGALTPTPPTGSVLAQTAFKMPRNGSLVSLVGQVTLTTLAATGATGTTVTLTVYRAVDGSGVYSPLTTPLGLPVTVSIVIPTSTIYPVGTAFTETTPFLITPSAIGGGIPLFLGDNLALVASSTNASNTLVGTIDAGIGIL
jgi:hypothetical protein